jgi:transcriptional regulator GlxA family with amidase domain
MSDAGKFRHVRLSRVSLFGFRFSNPPEAAVGPLGLAVVLVCSCFLAGFVLLSAQIPKPAERPLRVGILIYDGVFSTEFIASLDVFHHAEARTKKVEVFTVGPHLGSVLTAEGLKVIPHRTFANAPNVDILVVPGGKNFQKDVQDRVLVDWIRERARKARIVHANGSGAFLLGVAGVLDGHWAVTCPPDAERLQKTFPRVIVKAGARIVDDPVVRGQPRVITSAGGMLSYDAALYIVEGLCGRELAESIAAGLLIDRTATQTPLVRPPPQPDSASPPL